MHQLVFNDLQKLWNWLKKIIPQLNLNYKHLIVIKRYYQKRSINQNNTYFCWLTGLANYTGDHKDTFHEYYKREFLPWEEVQLPSGLSYWEPGHTPNEGTVEFSEYMNKIHPHASEFFGYHLPYPSDPGFKEFFEKYKTIQNAMEIKFVERRKK
jgi:hypothetical protein